MSCSRSSWPRLAVITLVIVQVSCTNASETVPAPISLVLVTLDTTRVDHLSSYGYERATTPRLDDFAKRAVRHRRAWSTSSWTLPAHASLFTGLYPSRHGAHYMDEGAAVLGEVLSPPLAQFVRAGRLPEERTTLAEILSQAGYRTAAFVAGPWLNRSFGLMQGFEVMDDETESFGGRSADVITDRAVEWLNSLQAEDPYFLFVNYFDPHAPYHPRGEHPDLPRAQEPFEPDHDSVMRGESELSRDQREILRDRYDAEIREMDAELGRLLDAVLALENGRRTLVIVTADHGEALGEEGRFGHGFWLSEELIRIPLLVRFPDERGAGTWSDRPIQLVDLLPLVAAELRLTLPDEVEGMQPGQREIAIAELYREATTVLRYGQDYDRDFQVAIDWPYKIERLADGSTKLSRLRDDGLQELPEEFAADRSERLRAALEVHVSGAPDPEMVRPEVSAETVEALRSLGYIE